MTIASFAKHKLRQRTHYWTRARVLDALRRYYRVHGETPLSSQAWQAKTKSATRTLPPYRPYPSHSCILRYFRSLRQAWAAIGITTDRAHEDFTPEEHWYIREAAGIIPRDEIARDLRRTPMAVKSYLRDHGLHSYLMRGWALYRIRMATGLSAYHLHRAVEQARVPAVRGSKCIYVQPADLVGVLPVEWERAPELALAARRQWYARLLGVLGRMSECRGGATNGAGE